NHAAGQLRVLNDIQKEKSIMGNFFVSIYNFFAARKAWLWTCAIACFALAAVLAARIQLEEDITRILPRDKTLDKLQQVFSDSRFADKLVLIIAQEDTTAPAQPDSLTQFAAELGLTLAENKALL